MEDCSARPARGGSGTILFLLGAAAAAACTPRVGNVPRDRVNPQLLAVSEQSPLTVSDTLESLIAAGRDTEDDRRFAYGVVAGEAVRDAANAFGRAAIAGRLAQVSGLSAPTLVKDAERHARMSIRLDRDFRHGAAQRMLGTLYVLAPPMLLEHGDSEEGLEILLRLLKRYPEDLQTNLRVAEAYVALGDEETSHPHLCFCIAHRQELRPDEQTLLARLSEDADLGDCP